MTTRTLRLILGDQLTHSMSSLSDIDPRHDRILMCEVREEATYVKHHKKKIAFVFSAMRHFAKELQDKGYQVHYTKLDDPENTGSFRGEVSRILEAEGGENVVVTMPGEFRVLQDMEGWQEDVGVPVDIRPDDRFVCSPEDFAKWAAQRQQLRMEFFYREMRKQHHVLMNGNKPEGGQWNYDKDNRKPPKEGLSVPDTYRSKPDKITNEVLKLVAEQFTDHFGDLEPFHFAVTRRQALEALDQFIAERLDLFGDYQDAMVEGEPWMYHSHLSLYLNCGLLQPLECVRQAEEAYRDGRVPLNAVEGFIRQILGWREFVRGIYWLRMPEYAQANYLGATRALPWLYWGGDTHMHCLHQCVKETQQHAYAHHIQRLMVLGNFALLAGIHPEFVNEWYLVVYADAYEWVELPNVSGMCLYADGGYLASKPYIAGGAYINRMSDYCKGCSYKVTKKNGPDACPFNYLYWNFLLEHKNRLGENPRMSQAYRTLEKMESKKIRAIKKDASRFLAAMENGETV